MLIGDKKLFAIEFELDENFEGAWLYGKICFWSGGVQIGDYDLGTSLRDVIPSLKTVVKDSGRRDMSDITATSAARMIEQELYGEAAEGSSLDTPARFEVCPNVDVFDKWRVYAFDYPCHSEIVFWKRGEIPEHVTQVPRGYFDSVASEVYARIDAMYAGQVE